MGDSLVKTGLGKNTQDAKYYDSPEQAMGVANQNLANANYGDPGMSFSRGDVSIDPASGMPGYTIDESGAFPGGDVPPPKISGGNLKPNFLSASPQLLNVVKPSPEEAAVAGKGLTKKGLLLNILLGAAGGAAAGAGTYGGEGFQRGAAFTNNRKLQFLNQQRQAEQDKRQAAADQRSQQQLDQNASENKSQADLRTQQIKESESKVNAKEKTAQEIYAEDIKAGLTPEEAKQHAYKINQPHQDANPTEASLALRAARGDEEAIKALGFIKANKEHPKGSRAADHADKQADAEDQAGRLLDAAGGDPNKAMELFNKALATGKVDRYHLSLAPSIRNSIRGGRRVQNADPLAGLLNNNSPQ